MNKMFCFIVSISIALLAIVGCKHDKETVATSNSASVVERAPVPSAAPVPELTESQKLYVQLKNVSNLPEAISIVKPVMGDMVNNADDGTALMAAWLLRHYNFNELNKIETTKFPLVMKSSELEKGKRICTSGSVIEIVSKKTNDGEITEGGLLANGRVYRFIGVGSSGEIAEGSYAAFCGIVTGKYSYSNSGGGMTHAVQLVGMFDLPENKKQSQS